MKPPKFFVRTVEAIFHALGFKSTITIKDRKNREIDSYDPVGSPEWFEWLDHKSTRLFLIDELDAYVEGELCEARKDQDGNWYVAAKRNGQNYQVHIGPSKDMTADNMITAMEQLLKLPYQKK